MNVTQSQSQSQERMGLSQSQRRRRDIKNLKKDFDINTGSNFKPAEVKVLFLSSILFLHQFLSILILFHHQYYYRKAKEKKS